jgi:hypothetical protein
MDPRRLRLRVTLGVIAATAATAVAIGSDPLPHSAPVALPDTALAGADRVDSAALAAREARAAARLQEAERRLRAIAAAGSSPVAPAATPAAPVVSVAPPAQAPVTRSASS